MLMLATNVDQKSLETVTEFLIAICRPTDTVFIDFLSAFINVKSVLDCHLPSVILKILFLPTIEISKNKLFVYNLKA